MTRCLHVEFVKGIHPTAGGYYKLPTDSISYLRFPRLLKDFTACRGDRRSHWVQKAWMDIFLIDTSSHIGQEQHGGVFSLFRGCFTSPLIMVFGSFNSRLRSGSVYLRMCKLTACRVFEDLPRCFSAEKNASTSNAACNASINSGRFSPGTTSQWYFERALSF